MDEQGLVTRIDFVGPSKGIKPSVRVSGPRSCTCNVVEGSVIEGLDCVSLHEEHWVCNFVRLLNVMAANFTVTLLHGEDQVRCLVFQVMFLHVMPVNECLVHVCERMPCGTFREVTRRKPSTWPHTSALGLDMHYLKQYARVNTTKHGCFSSELVFVKYLLPTCAHRTCKQMHVNIFIFLVCLRTSGAHS